MFSNLKGWFRKTIVLNLALVFLVIAAGSIVRATGSGMGCPDWPTCFGKLIPPTHVDQVSWFPEQSYKKGEMIIKDENLLVAIQDVFTSDDFTASNWKEYEKHEYAIFNPFHTWIEFINRLATVVLGFPVMLMLGLSLLYWNEKKLNILLSAIVVLLIGFQAWLGKLVVDNNLQGTTITYHMVGVFAILAVLIWLYHENKKVEQTQYKLVPTKLFNTMVLASIIITLLMVVLGTQVREEIDAIAKLTSDRHTWIDQLSNVFVVHRSLVWLVLTVNGYLLYSALKYKWYTSTLIQIGAVILVEALVGIIISYFGVPAISQPIHLFLAAILFALQFDLYLKNRYQEVSNATI